MALSMAGGFAGYPDGGRGGARALVDLVRCRDTARAPSPTFLLDLFITFVTWILHRFIWCLAYCMLVEINTWLLIAKRTIPVALPLMEVLFYISWVVLRCIWYPYLVIVFYKEWQAEWVSRGTPWNPILVAPVFQVLLTGLNLHWSWALFSKERSVRPKQL